MKRHIQFKHKGGAILCSACDFKTDTLAHNESTLKCPHCNYMVSGDYTLKKHMLIHEDPTYFCTECNYKKYDAPNFFTHRTKKHIIVNHAIMAANLKEVYDSIKATTITKCKKC